MRKSNSRDVHKTVIQQQSDPVFYPPVKQMQLFIFLPFSTKIKTSPAESKVTSFTSFKDLRQNIQQTLPIYPASLSQSPVLFKNLY